MGARADPPSGTPAAGKEAAGSLSSSGGSFLRASAQQRNVLLQLYCNVLLRVIMLHIFLPGTVKTFGSHPPELFYKGNNQGQGVLLSAGKAHRGGCQRVSCSGPPILGCRMYGESSWQLARSKCWDFVFSGLMLWIPSFRLAVLICGICGVCACLGPVRNIAQQ